MFVFFMYGILVFTWLRFNALVCNILPECQTAKTYVCVLCSCLMVPSRKKLQRVFSNREKLHQSPLFCYAVSHWSIIFPVCAVEHSSSQHLVPLQFSCFVLFAAYKRAREAFFSNEFIYSVGKKGWDKIDPEKPNYIVYTIMLFILWNITAVIWGLGKGVSLLCI